MSQGAKVRSSVWLCLGLSVLLFSALFCGPATTASDQTWIEVRTPHFDVYSNGTEKQARNLAKGFEQIRSVFAVSFPELRTDSGAQTIVVGPKDEESMKALVPAFWVKKGAPRPVGFFRQGWEKNYALIRLDEEGSNNESVYHEYIHQLVSLNFTRIPPWLNEGLAEFYGNTKFDGDHAFIGAPSERLALLWRKPIVPLEKLVAAGPEPPYKNDDEAQMFYAESWALTHFLMFGKGMGNGERFNQFVHELQLGKKSMEAFREIFGEPSSIEDQFDAYTRQFTLRAFDLKQPVRIDASSFAAHKLSPAEADAALGGFYMYLGQFDTAKERLSAALSEDPTVSLAHENMGFWDFQHGQDADALHEFDQAAVLNPNSYLAIYYRAMLTYYRKMDNDSLTKLDAALKKVGELNPRFAPAVAERSHIACEQKRYQESYDLAVQAERLEPDRPGYRTNVAEILLLVGHASEAIAISKFVSEHWSGPDSSEALAILSEARSVAKIQPTPEETNQEDAKLAYAAELNVADGTVQSMTCSKSEPMQLVLLFHGQPMTFTGAKNFGFGFSDVIWYGGDHVNACHHIDGMKAVVRYKTSSDNPPKNEFHWLEIRNDIDPTIR